LSPEAAATRVGATPCGRVAERTYDRHVSSDPSAQAAPSNRGLHPYWLVALVVFACLGCPTYVVWTTFTDRVDKAGMTAAATSYLDAWRDGQPSRAEGWICGSERAKQPSHRRLPYPGDEDLDSYRLVKAKVHRRSRGPTTYSVEAELLYADGKRRLMRYWMSDERAGWRVCTESAIS
jgi:hypothetical protein